jgi:hypothetical protein
LIVLKAFPLLISPDGRYNSPMFSRLFPLLLIVLLLGMGLPSKVHADGWGTNPDPDAEDENVKGGFAPPYEYERQAYGYDPEGVTYKENQAEDFQVIFITATPFTAMASFVLYGTVSLVNDGTFGIGGDLFLPFVGTALAGSTAIACISVLTNPYPPPNQTTFSENQNQPKALAFEVPLVTAKF